MSVLGLHQAVAGCLFPGVRADEGLADRFSNLCHFHRVPLDYVYSVFGANGHWMEVDSSVSQADARFAFVEWEYSTVDRDALIEALQSRKVDYDHPTLLMVERDPRLAGVDVPVCDLRVELLPSLKSKYRYMVNKAMEPELRVTVQKALTDAQTTWALRNICHRFAGDNMVHAMTLFLWSVARWGTQFLVLENEWGIQAIGGFQEAKLGETKMMRFASFASALHAVPNVGLRTLVEAAAEFTRQGYDYLDPTARCTLFDGEDPNYVFKRRIANAEWTMSAGSATTEVTTFFPPYYLRDKAEWKLAP
jgi:hypothetical protein